MILAWIGIGLFLLAWLAAGFVVALLFGAIVHREGEP